jgi:hypothetical protein
VANFWTENRADPEDEGRTRTVLMRCIQPFPVRGMTRAKRERKRIGSLFKRWRKLFLKPPAPAPTAQASPPPLAKTWNAPSFAVVVGALVAGITTVVTSFVNSLTVAGSTTLSLTVQLGLGMIFPNKLAAKLKRCLRRHAAKLKRCLRRQSRFRAPSVPSTWAPQWSPPLSTPASPWSALPEQQAEAPASPPWTTPDITTLLAPPSSPPPSPPPSPTAEPTRSLRPRVRVAPLDTLPAVPAHRREIYEGAAHGQCRIAECVTATSDHPFPGLALILTLS